MQAYAVKAAREAKRSTSWISPNAEYEKALGDFIAELLADPERSAFLKDFRELSAEHTRGCVVLERPDLVKDLVQKHGARDTTIRGTAMAELDAMTPRFSQWLPGEVIPEQHWMYRWAKKWWFNDFGAYTRADHDKTKREKARELAAVH